VVAGVARLQSNRYAARKLVRRIGSPVAQIMRRVTRGSLKHAVSIDLSSFMQRLAEVECNNLSSFALLVFLPNSLRLNKRECLCS
jgi:hypothetical protein